MDKKINLGILVNNIVGESHFLAEHGFSILIQVQEGEKKKKIIYLIVVKVARRCFTILLHMALNWQIYHLKQ